MNRTLNFTALHFASNSIHYFNYQNAFMSFTCDEFSIPLCLFIFFPLHIIEANKKIYSSFYFPSLFFFFKWMKNIKIISLTFQLSYFIFIGDSLYFHTRCLSVTLSRKWIIKYFFHIILKLCALIWMVGINL